MSEISKKLIEEQLRELELELLQPVVRQSPERLSCLLADGFREFGSSGSVYGKGDIIQALQTELLVQFSISDFHVEIVNSDVVLATYRTIKRALESQAEFISLRSSLWILNGDQWQMLFHQGTKVPS